MASYMGRNPGDKPLQQLSKQDQDAMLLKCADGEVLLYVELRPFKAKLQAQSWARSPKQAVWTADARTKVWLNPAAASLLLSFPDADVKWFEPEGSDDENHPFHDHVFYLEVPQTVTREQVYFVGEDTEQSKERTEAQQRQADLIKAVREQMQEQYDQGDKVNRMQALRDLEASGELRRLGFKGDNVLIKCRKQTDPNQVKELGLDPLPR